MRSALASALLLVSLEALAAPVPAGAQETQSANLFTTRHSLDLERISNAQISPDGRQIIYTRGWVNQLEDKWESALWIMDSNGGHNRFLAKGANARWSPDGYRVAFLAEGEPKGSQIFVKWIGTEGSPSQITRVAETPADIQWSPDGKSIGFTMFVPKPVVWKIDMPTPPAGGKWTGPPRIVQQLHFKQDQRGFSEPGNRHLFAVTADGGTPRQLTSGDWSVGARFDVLDGSVGWSWSRDGKSIVVDGFSDSTADLNYRNSNIYLVDAGTGATRRLTTDDGVWAGPVSSPDGKLIAFSGYPATKASFQAAEVYVMPFTGGPMRKISGTLDRGAGQLIWAEDGSGVYFSTEDHGASNIYFAPINGGLRQVTTGVHTFALNSISRGGIGAGVESVYDRPNDVVRIDLQKTGSPTVWLTSANADVLDRIQLGQVEKITYPSADGARIDGWIVKPPSFEASKKDPLMMEIHGGPHG